MLNNKLQILYEDEHIVAINKPSKMLVHRSKIDKTETEFAVQRLRDQIGQPVYCLHRLDKPTSGALLFAKSSEVASLFQPIFATHSIDKGYVAVVRGYVNQSETVDYPLVEKLDKTTDNLNKDNPPRHAITQVNPIVTVEIDKPVSRYQTARFSIVELLPKTGRKHQLRRHMAHLRHPIIGDTTHGDGKQNRFAKVELANQRLLLHAFKLSFIHPELGKKIDIFAPLDEAFIHTISFFDIESEVNASVVKRVLCAISK
ncbi:MAG: pseudouridine synthase [Pseudomonadota bacterium]